MREHPNPIVGIIRGRALAGGCGLASACDLVLATDKAEFGYPEVYLGFVPALVMTVLRRKMGEGQAFELVAQGDRFGADEARRLGLVNRIWPSEDFDAGVDEYLGRLAKKPASAVRLTKSLLYELDGLDFDSGLDRAAEVNGSPDDGRVPRWREPLPGQVDRLTRWRSHRSIAGVTTGGSNGRSVCFPWRPCSDWPGSTSRSAG